MDFLGSRFLIAALLMALIRPRQIYKISLADLKAGVPLGILLAAGFITQTIGLELTTAAISGFLTGLYVVLTPVFGWLIYKTRVNKKLGIAIFFALSGLAILSGTANSELSFQIGQIWLIACAVVFALHITLLGKYSQGRDSYNLAFIQIATVGALCLLVGSLDGYSAPPSPEVWFAILFTAVFATVIAFWVQTWAQSVLDSARVALLLTSEVAYAAIIAVAVGQEVLSLSAVIGGSLMVTAMLIVEWPTKGNQVAREPIH
jgi:drug/metabolite transporter (DMT)-like permease